MSITLNQKLNDLEVLHYSKSLSILHVDDDSSTLEISKKILSEMDNFDVDSSLSVDEAFYKLSKQKYDAVVSDFEMPNKNGLEFFQALRSHKNNIVFVLFTGRGNEEVASRALNLGVEGYFCKEGSTEKVYGALARGVKLLVDQKHSQTSLSGTEPFAKRIFKSSTNTIFDFKLNDQINTSEIKRQNFEATGTSFFEKDGFSTSMPTIKCPCGAHILVIPDLQAMNKAIELHLRDHRKKGMLDSKQSDLNVNVNELLIKELFKAIVQMDG